MSKREYIQQIPNRITGVVLGLVFYYNAQYLGEIVPSKWEGFVEQNMQLVGVVLAGLSILQLSINWYLVSTEEYDQKKF